MFGIGFLFWYTNTHLIEAFDYDGTPFNIDSIEESKNVILYSNRLALKRNGKWGFYDKNGTNRISHIYDEVSEFKYKEDIAMVKINQDVFFIDTIGIRINKPPRIQSDYSFEDIYISLGMSGFQNPDYEIIGKKKKKGLFDSKGKILIPAIYEDFFNLNETFKRVTAQKNGKYGLLNFTGDIIIPFEYESVIILNDYL